MTNFHTLTDLKINPRSRLINSANALHIAQLFLSGVSIVQIQKYYGFKNYNTIVDFLILNKLREPMTLETFNKSRRNEIDVKKLKTMIANGKGLKYLAKFFKTSVRSIKNIIKKHNISIDIPVKVCWVKKLNEHKKEIIDEYYKTNCLACMSRKFCCPTDAIRNFLKKHNVMVQSKNNYTKFDENTIANIKDLYINQNKTLKEIAQFYNCSSPKISSYLLNAGIKIKNKIELLNQRNSNAEFQLKCLSNSGKNKLYILPSGREIQVRGYENLFLDYVFSKNILVESEISFKPARIQYMYKDTSHYYYPDFYIEKFNLIIEIKSTWIDILQGIDRNYCKEYSVKQLGMNFLKIMNNDFSSLNEFIDNYHK